MNDEAKTFLFDLLETPSPSGFEGALQKKVADRARSFGAAVEVDPLGNLIAGINTGARRKVMLSGHCDQIGFIVTKIDSSGFIHVDSVGGADEATLLGERVVVHSRSGPIRGVFGKKATHLQTKAEKDKVPLMEDVWICVGAKDKQDAERWIEPGDYVTFTLGVTQLANGLVSAPGLDNKAGLFVILEALRLCAKEKLGVAIYGVSTVQEELGGRGAESAARQIRPDIGVTVDVTHASDEPGTQGEKAMPPVRLGGGPVIPRGPGVSPVIGRLMEEAAGRAEIGFQLSPSGKPAPNDSKSVQIAPSAVAVIDLGIPNRNMHTQAEICDLADINATVRLLVDFLKRLDEKTPLAPFEV